MSPHETLFRLEATQSLERAVVDHTPLCRFTIWDFPGDYYGAQCSNGNVQNTNISGSGYGMDILSRGINDNIHNSAATTTDAAIFSGSSTSLIFVVDAQDEPYDHVLQSFTNAVTKALALNPNIVVEVFINKVDGELFLSDESKYDCRRDIMTQVTDELTDAGVSPDSIQIRYHLTSIYDHSIFEALSRVVQRLIPQLQPTLENLLNVLVSTCSMEKAYLFDVVSKLYISTDPGPVDMQSVELCSDMIDVVLDVSGIYGLGPSHCEFVGAMVAGEATNTNHNGMVGGGGAYSEMVPGVSLGPIDPIYAPHHHTHITHNLIDPMPSMVMTGNSQDASYNSLREVQLTTMHLPPQPSADELVGTLISQAPAEDLEEEMVDPDSAYDSDSASVIRLSNGMVRDLMFAASDRFCVCLQCLFKWWSIFSHIPFWTIY